MVTNNLVCDVLVAGAGPAGALAALVLARAGRQVFLVDKIRKDKYKVGESLPGAARQILQSLDLLNVLESGSHLINYANVSAWGSDQLVINDFINDPRGLGWHLDRVEFDEALRLAACSAGACMLGNRVKAATKMDSIWKVQLKDCEVEANWFIDATGRTASLAHSQGAIRQRDIPLFATYRRIVTSNEDKEARTFVEAVPDGWWYTAKLPHRIRVVIFHTDAQKAKNIRSQPDLWQTDLENTKYICKFLEGVNYNDLPHCIEAGGGYLSKFTGSQWVVAGDAALTFDPISSQGIFNALYTGMKAGQAVHTALTGDLRSITEYVKRLKEIRAAYCRHHSFIYCSENRWANHTFWSSRHKLLA